MCSIQSTARDSVVTDFASGIWRYPRAENAARIIRVPRFCGALLAATLLAASAVGGAQPARFGVRVDVSQVPNARPYVKPTRELITEWYPKINAILFGKDYSLPLNKVQVIFEPKSYQLLPTRTREGPISRVTDPRIDPRQPAI
jgi:hypothetical protein